MIITDRQGAIQTVKKEKQTMNETNTKPECNIGSKIYSDIKTVLHRFIVIILAIGIIVPLAGNDKGISLFFIGLYAIYHLTFFRFTMPRF